MPETKFFLVMLIFTRSFVAAPAMGLHSAIVMPYLTHYGTKEQQERYLPAMTAGECIAR